jgi:hypothetical protein
VANTSLPKRLGRREWKASTRMKLRLLTEVLVQLPMARAAGPDALDSRIGSEARAGEVLISLSLPSRGALAR